MARPPPPTVIVPMNVKAPFVPLMVYIETLVGAKPPSFATSANLPDGSTATEKGAQEPGLGGGAQGEAIVPADVKAPVVALMMYMDTLPPVTSKAPSFAT